MAPNPPRTHHHHSVINDHIVIHNHDPRDHDFDGTHVDFDFYGAIHHDDCGNYHESAVDDDDYPTEHLNDR